MTRIQSILAATDFSSDARHAVERAAILGATLKVQEEVLLHVLEQSWLDNLKQFIGTPAEVEREIMDNIQRSLSGFVEEIRQLSKVTLEPRIGKGNTLNMIVDAASGFDLLVLGARGKHPVRSLALGTTSQRLLGKTRKPILIVKRKPQDPYQRVLVAVDFSPNSLKALQYAPAVAPGSLIYLVHVFEPFPERMMISAGVSDEVVDDYRAETHLEAEAEMTRFVEEAGVDPGCLVRIVEHGHAPGKLPEIVHKWDPDLIVAGKHGRSHIEELFLGSVTLHLLSQSKCDVLVVQ